MKPATNIQEAPASTGRPAVSDKHCVFRVAESWYSLLATTVREVTMAPALVPVPGSDVVMAGLCHMRNEFIPVVYLEPLMGGVASGQTTAGKMLVLNGAAGTWAMLVDEIIALESLETLINPEGRSSDVGSTTVMGTATCRNQIVRVLDPNSLYRRAEELMRICWSELIQPRDDVSTAQLAER